MNAPLHFDRDYSKMTGRGICLHKFCQSKDDGFCQNPAFGNTAAVNLNP